MIRQELKEKLEQNGTISALEIENILKTQERAIFITQVEYDRFRREISAANIVERYFKDLYDERVKGIITRIKDIFLIDLKENNSTQDDINFIFSERQEIFDIAEQRYWEQKNRGPDLDGVVEQVYQEELIGNYSLEEMLNELPAEIPSIEYQQEIEIKNDDNMQEIVQHISIRARDYAIVIKPYEDITQEEYLFIQNILQNSCKFKLWTIYGAIKNYMAFIKDNSGNYLSVMTFHEMYYGGVEIYNICTNSAFRKKGYATQILKKIVDNESYRGRDIWLGGAFYDFEKQKYDRSLIAGAMNVYIKCGFKNIFIENVTPGGQYFPHRRPGISFYYGNVDDLSDSQAINVARRYIKAIEQEEKSELVPPKELYELIEKENEWAFTLKYAGALKIDKTLEGSEGHAPLILSSFFGHSHPIAIHLKYYMLLGWPSSIDFNIVFFNNLIYKNYVVSYRGIYMIELTDAGRIMSKILRNFRHLLVDNNAVRDRLVRYESHRLLTHFDKELLNSIEYILNNCGASQGLLKEFQKLIVTGCKNREGIENLAFTYINSFLQEIEQITCRDIGLNVDHYVNDSRVSLQIQEADISLNSTIFKIKFYPK